MIYRDQYLTQYHVQYVAKVYLASPKIGSAQKLFLPELLHNVQLLVDRTEQDILKSDRRLRHNRDLIVNLGYEKEELRKEVVEEEIQIDKLSEILALIDMWVC